MKNLVKKPFLIFWISAGIIFLINLLQRPETIDLNVHDTYFVTESSTIPPLIAIVFIFYGFGYWLVFKVRKRLYNLLSFVHILLTIGGTILIWLILLFWSNSNLESDNAYVDGLGFTDIMTSIVLLMILIGQILFPINLIVSMIRKKNMTSG